MEFDLEIEFSRKVLDHALGKLVENTTRLPLETAVSPISKNISIQNISIHRKEILLVIIKVFLVFRLSPILNITIMLLKIERIDNVCQYVSQLRVVDSIIFRR